MNTELRLPPSGRDFAIFEAVHQDGTSTWRLAEEHGISQTRVRQIMRRVAEWLADSLPVKTDEQRENEVRLAQHLAADRLQNLYREMMTRWRTTNDTACIRQMTRLTLAMARLGVVAGTLEGVMADAEEVQGEMTNDQISMTNEESGQLPVASGQSEFALADAAGFQSAIRNPQSAIPPAPPVRDFSGNSAKRDVQQRRQEFLRGGNTEAIEGYVPLPRPTDEEDIEAIENWIELLSDAGRKAAGVKPKAESREPITEVHVGPEEAVMVK